MVICEQDFEATLVNGNGTETGQIIVTSIGGRNGKPKQVPHLFTSDICWKNLKNLNSMAYDILHF